MNSVKSGAWYILWTDNIPVNRRMKISLVQCKAGMSGIDSTLMEVERLIGQGTGAGIYILPEMFATGQCIGNMELAQDMDGQIVCWMKKMSNQLDAAVAGSVLICGDGRFYNRFCFVRPDGTVQTYDKRHLFSYAGENRFITPGSERRIIEFRGVRILPQVCYDLRFPIFSRNRDDYDIAIYVANWPVKRQLSWDILLRARAIENQAYVAGVNIVGQDEFGVYEGHTALVSPYGEAVVKAEDSKSQIITGALDMERLVHFRSKFPVLNDADIN